MIPWQPCKGKNRRPLCNKGQGKPNIAHKAIQPALGRLPPNSPHGHLKKKPQLQSLCQQTESKTALILRYMFADLVSFPTSNMLHCHSQNSLSLSIIIPAQGPMVDMSWQLDPATPARRMLLFKAAKWLAASLSLPSKTPNWRARPRFVMGLSGCSWSKRSI